MATDKEKIQFIKDSLKHKQMVSNFLIEICHELMLRGNYHDDSKLSDKEVNGYAGTVPKLKGKKYGTSEYKEILGQMKPAINHHQSVNDHHPEFFIDGIGDMNLIQLMEMIADWVAASRRGSGKNILETLPMTCKKFGIGDQLEAVLLNTVTNMGW
jgi:hypothetical protein